MPTSEEKSFQELDPTKVFYSDTFVSASNTSPDRLEGIRTRLASMSIGQAKDDDLPRSKIHWWQRWADQQINSKLSAVYKIPLIRITRTGRNHDRSGTPVAFFPDPIQDIAIAMVVAQIVLVEYTDVDPNTNDAANALQQWAEDRLNEIAGADGIVGTIELEGQDHKARSHFAPPTAMPRNIPQQ